MNALWIALALLAAVVVLIGLFAASVYNALVKYRERFKSAYAQIDVQLKRRYDLIPNLVETVKGYMTHERDTLQAVIEARNAAVTANQQAAAQPGDPAAMRNISGAENQLAGALGRLLMVQENYPELKASQHAGCLMEELTSTENRIAFARQHYNDSVMTYNSYRQSFPQVIVASPLGFGEAVLFEIDDPAQRQAAQVSFQPASQSMPGGQTA